ncbi:MAG: hypothetical protein AAGA48_19215 [Myxococcota bacterium]
MRLTTLALGLASCVSPELVFDGPEDTLLVGEWWQNIDTNKEEYEGTCAVLQEDGDAFALVPSQQYMYKTAWAAGGPGVVYLREGTFKLGSIAVERSESGWFATYSGLLLGGMEAWLEPGCDEFDLERIVLE